MAVPGDFDYLNLLLDRGSIAGSVLEVGSHNWQESDLGNARTTVTRRGLEWTGTDIEAGRDVDFLLDILDPAQVEAVGDTWDTVLVMNLLEHVYDPIRALESSLTLVAPGGSLVAVVPAIWQLHDYPGDFWRPMPDFFLEFARRADLKILDSDLQWITLGGLLPVMDLRDGDQKVVPNSMIGDRLWGRKKYWRSKILHRIGRTSGRDTVFPYVGLGVCMTRDVAPESAQQAASPSS